ncbi:MAG: hypothetical protein HXS51_10625 [Theionarchaea archaeon]|nr:hypothetical protein [Theionarchaea archaeon]
MDYTYKDVKFIRGVVLSAVILMLLSLSLAGATESSPEVQITDDQNDQRNPSISGSYVVWEDNRNGNKDIYGYNLETGEEFQITDDPHDQYNPSVSGSYVVWEDNRNGNYDVYGFDLETGKEFRITWDSSNQKNPDISGTLVVWQDDRHHTDWEIYGCDLSSSEEIRITENRYDQVCPRVSGDSVVWIDERDGKDAVYGCDLTNRREFRVCKDTYPCEMAPGNGAVVFLERAHSDTLLSVYTISTGKKVQIAVAENGMNIDCEGTIIVWGDMYLYGDSDLGSGIFGYDLSTERLLSISSGEWIMMRPGIYGATVVWEDYRNGNWDIYGCNIEEIPFQTLRPRPPFEYYYGILTALSVIGAFFRVGVHPSQRHDEEVAKESPESHVFKRSFTSSVKWFGFGAFWIYFGFFEVYCMNHLLGFVSLIICFFYFTLAFWYVRTPYLLTTRDAMMLFDNALKKPQSIEWDNIQKTLVGLEKKRIDLKISDNGIVRIRLSDLDKKDIVKILQILQNHIPL